MEFQNSKLYLLLSTFDKEEQKEFARYIGSAYFNRNSDLPILYELLVHKNILLTDKLVSRLYHNKKRVKANAKDINRLRNAMSRLLKLAENFLKHREIELYDNNFYLAEALMKRQLFRHCQSVLTDRLQHHYKEDLITPRYYYSLFLLEEAMLRLNGVQMLRPLQSNINVVVRNLENYAFTMMLNQYVVVAVRSRLYDIEDECEISSDILSFCEKKFEEAEFSVLAKVDFCVIKLLKGKNDYYFAKAIHFLDDNRNKLPTTEKRSRLNAIVNVCLWNVLEGKESYRHKLKEIYEIFIPQEVWTKEVHLNIAIFYMVAWNYLELGEIDNAKSFVTDYKDNLPPHQKDDLLHLIQATILFHEKKWADSLQSLSLFFLKEADFYFSLYYRALLIKLYYELGEYEPLQSAANALGLYLSEKRNAKITRRPRASFSYFRKCAMELTRIKEGNKPKRSLEKIHAEVKNHPYLHERNWLLAKAEELG